MKIAGFKTELGRLIERAVRDGNAPEAISQAMRDLAGEAVAEEPVEPFRLGSIDQVDNYAGVVQPLYEIDEEGDDLTVALVFVDSKHAQTIVDFLNATKKTKPDDGNIISTPVDLNPQPDRHWTGPVETMGDYPRSTEIRRVYAPGSSAGQDPIAYVPAGSPSSNRVLAALDLTISGRERAPSTEHYMLTNHSAAFKFNNGSSVFVSYQDGGNAIEIVHSKVDETKAFTVEAVTPERLVVTTKDRRPMY